MRIIAGAVTVYLSLAWLLVDRYVRHRGWRVLPVLLAVPALVFTLNELRWWHFEHGLAQAVRPVLAGRDSGFGCERVLHGFFSSQGHPGHVWFDENGTPASQAFLSSSTCSRVKAYQRDPASAGIDEVVAVHTVTHEAEHLSGVQSEGVAECRAMQADAAVMVALGARPETAQAQVRSYLGLIYPRLPDEYRGAQCVDGGALDLSPGDGSWP
ncbi:hypothetical protein ACPPVT_20955 [Angustibacter sp. McL0619]|uniref:hypothetical protein n=1 Tax=Angustibacter sp. McL0619 TaxID=3415676 RepID=UPI003CFB1305